MDEKPKNYPWIGALLLMCTTVVCFLISMGFSYLGGPFALNTTWWKEQLGLVFTIGGGSAVIGLLLFIYSEWAGDSIQSFWFTFITLHVGVVIVGIGTGLWLAIG